jgi:4-amino-4-deoxy-L-arabinose transferase-like glycosyltransferase
LNSRARIADYLLLIAVPAFFFLWKLSAFGLIGADEPRYAQVAREMLARHNWVTPTLGGTPWLEKPPLYYWQAILAYRVFGVSDWAARLPSVVDAFLLVVAIYFFLRRFRPGVELDGALIAATTAGTVGFSRAASTDMPLTAMFAICMLAWYGWFESGEKKYLLGFYLFLALAMLAKGPVAPFLAILVIVLFAAANRSAAMIWKTFSFTGILTFLVFGLPWYVLVQLRNPQFFHDFIIEHNLARFGTNLYHHPEPFWYYVPVTLLGWVPWAVFVIAAIVWAAKHVKKSDADALHTFLLIWIAAVVIFFSLSKSKLPGYVLPAIPAGAILAALLVQSESRMKTITGAIRIGTSALHAALLAALVFCALIVDHLVLHQHIPWRQWEVRGALVVALAIGLCILYVKVDWRILRVATLAPLILATALALRLGAEPLDDTLSARPIANELSALDTHHLPVAVFLVPRETEFGLAFYRNQIIERYELHQIPSGEHVVVVAEGFRKSIARETGRTPIYLGNFAPQKLEFFYVPGQ